MGFRLLTLIIFLLAPLLNAKTISLKEAMDIGLKNSYQLKLSDYDKRISWQKYQQAISALHPKIDFNAKFLKLDEQPNFDLYSVIDLSSVTAPLEQALGLPQNSISSSQVYHEKIKLYGDEIWSASINMTYPLFTGGKINSIISQASVAHQIQTIKSIHETKDLKLRILKAYVQTWFAKKMELITLDTLEKVKYTYELTKKFFEAGTNRINKLDLLKIGYISKNFSALHEEFQTGYEMSVEYLNFIINSKEKLEPTSEEIDFNLTKKQINTTDINAIKDNPILKMSSLATKVYEAKKDEANSEYYPNIALVANLNHQEDNYEYGYFTKENKNSYNFGVGVEWNLFNGFATNAKSQEARIALAKSKLQKDLTKKTLALKYTNTKISYFGKKRKLSKLTDAYELAKQRTSLSERAYSQGLIKTKELLEAQVYENFVIGLILNTKKELSFTKGELEYLRGKK